MREHVAFVVVHSGGSEIKGSHMPPRYVVPHDSRLTSKVIQPRRRYGNPSLSERNKRQERALTYATFVLSLHAIVVHIARRMPL